MITLVTVRKKRNNAVSNLAIGMIAGLNMLDCCPVKVIEYESEPISGKRRIDPASISKETEWLMVPYWISNDLWSINFDEIKNHHPDLRIATYTGTSPFWNGAAVDYNPGNRWLDASGLPEVERKNFEAIDLFLVVWPRPGVKPSSQYAVGLGTFPEVKHNPKGSRPSVTIDFMKSGWDEDVYAESCEVLMELSKKMPNLLIQVLGQNEIAKKMFPPNDPRFICVPHSFLLFKDICSIWTSSWAFIAMNESFGYPLIENWFSGTPVFCSREAEIPSCHMVSPISMLEDHLFYWESMDGHERQEAADTIVNHYKSSHPEFSSWRGAAERALSAMGLS